MTSNRFAAMRGMIWTIMIVMLVGCGRPIGPTSGAVRFADGSPVSSGSIEFRRTSDKERFASRIASDGTFQPTSSDGEIGLPPGAYDIVVVQIVLTEDLAIESHSHGHSVPRRYADYYTTDLHAEIEEGETQPLEVRVDLDGDSESG